MTEYVVRSPGRIFGPFYSAQDAIDWVEKVRNPDMLGGVPLGVEVLEDPEVKLPPEPRGRPLADDDIAF